MKLHPALAASPGYRYTRFYPGAGKPGCESTPDAKKRPKTQWISAPGSSTRKIEFVPPKCQRPHAGVYFAPFRESGGRQDGAFAHCHAPVTDPDTPPPWQWTCDRIEFRQYVQLEDQGCTVTLVGNLSDAMLRWFKEVGLAELGDRTKRGTETMIKVRVHSDGRAFAMFGDSHCRADDSPTVFFLADNVDNSKEHSGWRVVDMKQWMEPEARWMTLL
ncbi:MAG: hypothetical protein AAGI72_05465 [Pseudomonadota bacterium]